MDVVAPTDDVIEVMRKIARSGFDYQQTRGLGEAATWKLLDDELDLGYVAFDIHIDSCKAARRRLVVELSESGRQPRAFVPLFSFEEHERETFDEAYKALAEQLTGTLGRVSHSGTYTYAHRANWPYSYSWWTLSDATFVLMQDEFDIQFGMDVSLWVLPQGTPVRVPVNVS
jgi:hypothetical protein